jgi:hypothetical protein
MNCPTIVAEIGCNHQGELEIAKEMVQTADMQAPRRRILDIGVGSDLEENGAFHFTRPTLRTFRARLGGEIAIHVMPDETGVEVDEPLRRLVAEHLARERTRRSEGLAGECREVR